MLMPNRFSNLKFSLLNTTALVIDCLIQDGKSTLSDLTFHLKKFSQEFERDDVLLAVTLLYALGRVEYSQQKDTVSLLSNEALKKGCDA